MAYLESRRCRGHPEYLQDMSTLPAVAGPDTEHLGDKSVGIVESRCPLGTSGWGYSLSGSGKLGLLHLLSS